MSRCPHCGETHTSENHFCSITGQPIDLGPRLVAQVLLEKYKIITVLGEGPIGIVLEVEEKTTGERFAAKLIHPQYTRGNSAVEKIINDIEAVQSLQSEHIAQIVDVGRDAGAAFTVVRELMTGQCLEALLEEKGPLSIPESMEIFKGILSAIDAIHGAGILNLDLSPADVFLAETSNGSQVKLVDIGERHIKAEIVHDASEGFESSRYYAPEQLKLDYIPHLSADIYAAGAILYEMLSGEVPGESPVPLSSLNNQVTSELSDIVACALSPDPQRRFDTVKDLLEALESATLEKIDAQIALDEKDESGSESLTRGSEPQPEPSGDEQASVIVSMTELSRRLSSLSLSRQFSSLSLSRRFPFLSSRNFHIATGVVVLFVFLLIFAWPSSEDQEKGEEGKKALGVKETVGIKVVVSPQEATVVVDGRRVQGNPVELDVIPDKKSHTVVAKADGYEPLERDVAFDKSKTIELSLIAVARASGKASPVEPNDSATSAEDDTDTASDSDTGRATEEMIATAPASASPPMQTGTSDSQELKADKQKQVKKQSKRTKTRKTAVTRTKRRASSSNQQTSSVSVKKKRKKSREGFTTINPFE